VILAVLALLVGLALGVGAMLWLQRRNRAQALSRRSAAHRIAFPFAGESLSEPALAAALRIAHAEGATLMPVYLALVPMRLSADVPLPAEAAVALPLLEAVEQRALRAHVPVDSRIERGRTVRHALRELMRHERFQRMVVAADADGVGGGVSAEDVAWLIEHAPGELIALRPAQVGGADGGGEGGGAAAQGAIGEGAAGADGGGEGGGAAASGGANASDIATGSA
jgi:hypothetical protein